MSEKESAEAPVEKAPAEDAKPEAPKSEAKKAKKDDGDDAARGVGLHR